MPLIAFRMILLITALLLIIANWYFFDRRHNYSIGLPAYKTYFALSSERYEDKAATMELRHRAAERIIDVMVQDEKIAAEVSRKLELLETGDLSILFNPQLTAVIEKYKPDSRKLMLDSALAIGRKVSEQATNREEQSALIWKHLKSTNLSQSERNVVFQMLDAILNPTLDSDKEMVKQLRSDVASQIPSVIKEIRPGTVIVQKGEIVTEEIAALLAHQGYPEAKFPWKRLAFILGVIIVWSMWPVWVANKLKLSVSSWLYMASALSLMWLFEVIFARIGGDYSMAVLCLTGWLCLTMPSSLSFHVVSGGGAIGALIAFGTNPGMVCLGSIMASFSAGIGGILFMNPPSNRIEIWKKLFTLGIVLGITSAAIRWGLVIDFDYAIILRIAGYSALWGIIVVAILPIWENMFDILSPLRLLELSHPSQPLMKRLQMEAPGTYNHVIMVGMLAESAADKLNMNGLLMRAGAYYHDIGKLKNPQFFVENQPRHQNLHDDLPAAVSGRILIAHVADGLKTARENNLPAALLPFIREHHGTTVQKYFYEKAKRLGENVTEADFTYPGPAPQTRETALLMFADSVEAAVKGRNKPFNDNDELRAFIEKVIESKFEAKQVDNVDFTMRELKLIVDSFAEAFQSTYHTREVKDIEQIVEETRRRTENEHAY